jgi:nitroreductase
MEVLEAMRRRWMHRSFDPSPLDESTLQKPAWAATRGAEWEVRRP